MGRSPCCSKEGLNKGAWTVMEDKILTDYITAHGEGKWRNLPKRAGLKRCGKSCRLRWLNYLRPDIKRGNISQDEEELIIRLHKLLGNRWSLIAGRLPGRTDNEIKNYWNTTLAKRVLELDNSSLQIIPRKFRTKKKVSEDHKACDHIHTPPLKVIRTKASRFTRVSVPQIPGIQTSEQMESNSQPHIISSMPNSDQNSGDDEFNYEIDSDFLNFEFQASGEGIEQVDQFLFEDWINGDSNNIDGHNAKLDIDSWAFLLDSEEWAV